MTRSEDRNGRAAGPSERQTPSVHVNPCAARVAGGGAIRGLNVLDRLQGR